MNKRQSKTIRPYPDSCPAAYLKSRSLPSLRQRSGAGAYYAEQVVQSVGMYCSCRTPNRPNDQIPRLLKSLGTDWIFLGSGRSADLIFSHRKSPIRCSSLGDAGGLESWTVLSRD